MSRAIRNNVPTETALDTFKRFKVFTLGLMFIFPIYPSLAAIGQISETQAGDYDASSIIFEYTDSEGVNTGKVGDNGIVKVDMDTNSGNSVETPKMSEDVDPAEKEEPVPVSDVKTYTVVENDDIFKIAEKNKVDPEIVLWTNNITLDGTLTVGQVLKLPSVTGVIHTLARNETISDVSKKYGISAAKILEANSISDPTKVREGRRLLVPGATPIIEKTVEAPVAQKTATPSKPTKTATPAKQAEAAKPISASTQVNANGLKDRYEVNFTGLGRGFVPGNCTWYVARNKTVTWRGNANQWIRNARAQGVPTGNTPVPGAIIQFSGHGYNQYYGHVGIVNEVRGNTLIISDMNYSGLYKVTVREIPINHPAIDGYIYVD